MIAIAPAVRILDVDRSIRKVVASELVASFPMPAANGVLRLLGFYYASFGPPPAPENKLYPPQWLVTLDDAGRVLEIAKKPTAFFGIDAPADEPFATHAYRHPWTGDDLTAQLDRFYGVYDNLLREWLPLRPEQRQAQGDSAAKASFREYFHWFSPPPLLKAYLTLSQDFFAWVGLGGKRP